MNSPRAMFQAMGKLFSLIQIFPSVGRAALLAAHDGLDGEILSMNNFMFLAEKVINRFHT